MMQLGKRIPGRVVLLGLCLLIALAGPAEAAPQFGADRAVPGAPSGAYRAVRAGNLLDVRSGRMLRDQVVLIRGDRIADVGPAADVRIPEGAQVLDLTRATVLPGLIDAHTHLFLTGESHGRYEEQLRALFRIIFREKAAHRYIARIAIVKIAISKGQTHRLIYCIHISCTIITH